MSRIVKLTAAVVLLLGVAPMIMAQGSCPAIVEAALRTAAERCQATGRNQACYGSFHLEATAQPGVTSLRFNQVGDIADVSAIQNLKLDGMNQETQEWGVAILKLQANLPGSLPGQNVTFVLFGDVEITNAADGQTSTAPMQAFTLRSGIGDSQCEETPASGLLVQTPQGAGKVNFTVNGVDISMGSTVFFQAQPGSTMSVRTVEGAAEASAQGRTIPVIAGTQISIPMDDELEAAGEPSLPEAYEIEDLAPLPFTLLEEAVEIADPLDSEDIEALWELIEAGEPVCGEEPLPSCDDLEFSEDEVEDDGSSEGEVDDAVDEHLSEEMADDSQNEMDDDDADTDSDNGGGEE